MLKKAKILNLVALILTLGILFAQYIPTSADEPVTISATAESLKNDLLSKAPYDKWQKTNWTQNQEKRDIDHLPYERLVELTKFYPEKINRLNQIYIETKSPDALAEIARLKDKFITVVKEIEYRDTKQVPDREIHHTTYYIDLTAGNDANTGLSTAQAWLTIEKYTTTTVRTAGDIAWVRANTTEIPAGSIVFDEDGTTNGGYIEIRGSSIADDPWGDASDVKPIIDFNTSAFNVSINGDDFWRFYRLDVRNSTETNSMFYITGNSLGNIIDTCDIHGANGGAASNGIRTSSGNTIIRNSNLYDNKIYNILAGGKTLIENSIFNGGAATTDYGIYVSSSTLVTISNNTFGVTTAHDVSSLFMRYGGGLINSYNSLFSDATEIVISNSLNSVFYSEDHDQVLGAHKKVTGSGEVSRDSAIQLDGYDSALMTPSSSCSSILPLTISSREYIGDYPIWVRAVATTITITAREKAAWAADPTNVQFYFEASYISTASGAPTRSTVVSTEALSGVTEVDFTMTFTPAREGFVYVTTYLKKYEDGKSVQVSVVAQ